MNKRILRQIIQQKVKRDTNGNTRLWTYQCRCGKKFITLSAILDHIKRKHKGARNFEELIQIGRE